MKTKITTNKCRRCPSTQSGQVVIGAVIFFLLITLSMMMALASPVAEQVRASGNYIKSAQGYITAEAQNSDARYRLNQGLVLPSTLTLALNNATSSATVVDVGNTKQVVSEATAYGRFTRTVSSVFSQDVGASFSYGLQTGNGGVSLSGGASIQGNVYSNGNIVGSGGTSITGTAMSANRSSAVSDQVNTGSSTPTYNITMATSSATEDFAQSFTVSTTSPLTEVWLYMRQNASLPNITVRITTNNAGRPSGTTLSSGSISTSQITSSYGWVATNPVNGSGASVSLTPGTTYWLVVDTAPWWNDPNTHFQWGGNTNGYAGGSMMKGKYGGSWTATSPTNLDSYFYIYLGGDYGLISGTAPNNGPIIGGSAHSHTVANATINGSLYCQSGTGNNKACNTSQADPAPNAYPISDSQIQGWKDEASAGVIRNSNLTLGSNTSTSTTGAMRINGNLTVSSGATLTINGTLYVTGNINMNGAGIIRLGNSYGTTAGVILVDGTTDLGGGAFITGNGQSGNYAFLVSTNTLCSTGVSCGNNYAIDASGGTGSVVLVAQDGGIRFSGGASAKAAVANYMTLSGGTTLIYETGLTNINFSNGPGGTWVVDEWQEI